MDSHPRVEYLGAHVQRLVDALLGSAEDYSIVW
jgi:hypothetical protein